MAEFEYNLLIIHNDTDAQGFLIRLFGGEPSEKTAVASPVMDSKEFIGTVECNSEEPNRKVSRKVHIRTADSVLEYTTLWEHHHQDAVLLNLFVPEEDTSIPSKEAGLRLLKRIKRVDPEAEVIVLSDQIFQDEAIEAIECGAFYFIPQPQIQGVFVRALISQIIKGKEAKYISNLDGLTGLYNRQFFDLMLKREVDAFGEKDEEHELRQGKELSVMIVDIDRFKVFNDTYLHVEGDRALRFIADTLKGAFRKSDIVARVGGDEFGILLPEANHTEAVHLAERARKIIREKPFVLKATEEKVHLTVSIGVATYPNPNTDLKSLYGEADRALMHGAKRAGGDSVYGYGDDGRIA